jgi:uncharacterized protein YndB with AHSA1/START domain
MAQAHETDKGATPQLPPLRLSRVFHARRETVFTAWSTAEHVKRWFCPETFTVPEATVEMRVGGPFELSMRSPAGEEHRISGTFVEVAPHTRLVIDMQVADATGTQLFRAYTEVDFADALGGTEMDVVQTYTIIDPSAAWMVQGAPQGWTSTLDKLEKEVIRMQGGTETGVRSVAHGYFTLKRTYDAPVARVWGAFTDESAKQKWFGGTDGRWELLERRMDVRVGGSERVKGSWEGGVVST